MILGRLFTELFGHGVVVVATSNVPPDELYREGLNRALFLPFVALIETHMELVRLEARTDFRLEKLASAPVWHVPADAAADAALAATWRQLTGSEAAGPQEFAVKGRILRVPRAARGAAWLSFPELCGSAFGAADYLKLAHEFHTIVLDGIPVMDYERRNEAKRFIVLIDTLYDRAVKLVASAQAEPEACRLLAELIGAGSSDEHLREAVLDQVKPWMEFTERTLDRVLGSTGLGGLVPGRQVSFVIVSLFLGMDLNARLEPANQPRRPVRPSRPAAAGLARQSRLLRRRPAESKTLQGHSIPGFSTWRETGSH